MFQAGHLPGAVPLDWHFDLSHTVHGLRDWLLPPERFAAVMAAAGIGDDTTTVAGAETDHSGAARLWWALRYYGHEQVAVLDGGLNERQAEGRPIETGAACLASTPVRFTARRWPASRSPSRRAFSRWWTYGMPC